MNPNSHNKHSHPLQVTEEEENESTAILDTYRYVNGRRFHNVSGVEYFMPNDKQVSLKNLHFELGFRGIMSKLNNIIILF